MADATIALQYAGISLRLESSVGLTEGQLAEDLTRAMKARDMSRVYVLRGLLAAAKNLKVERRGGDLGEADLAQLVRREIRKREEAEEFAARAGRAELVAQNRSERAILEGYAPQSLDAAALERVIREIAATDGGGSIGAIMAALRARHPGQFDGRQASQLARRVLAEA